MINNNGNGKLLESWIWDATVEKTTLQGQKRDQLHDLFRTFLHELNFGSNSHE